MIKRFEDFGNDKPATPKVEEKNWKVTVDLSDEWKSIPEEGVEDMNDEDFKKFITAISTKMKTFDDEIQKVLGDDELRRYEDHTTYIAQSLNPEEFEQNMTDLYDWADDENVWIKSMI